MARHPSQGPLTQGLPLRKHLLCARDFTYTISVHSTATKEERTLISLSFRWVRKLRPTGLEKLTQGHSAKDWQIRCLRVDLPPL